MHNLFLAYLSISTCFGQVWAHHQEKQLCLCDTCYLLFCVDDCLHTRQLSTQNNKYQVSQNTVVSPDDGPIVARNMYRSINILRINCALTWFYLLHYTEMHGQQNIKFSNMSLNSINKSITCNRVFVP